jgi:probable F420-dependent oxidoreductase
VALAKALATLDVVSNGRVSCGVGAGWMRAEFRRLGIPFEQRGAITDEYLRAMKQLWTSDAPSFTGRYVSFEDVSFFPKPVQQPSIPLYAGGSGPRPWRRVAELGDGWFPMTATPNEIRAGVAEIRRQMITLGRNPATLWVGYTGLSLGSDPEVQAMRRHVNHADAEPLQPPRDRDEIIATVERYAAAGVTFLSIGFAWQNAGELMRGLERFARDVLPAFR